jgi:hypothetical protein
MLSHALVFQLALFQMTAWACSSGADLRIATDIQRIGTAYFSTDAC